MVGVLWTGTALCQDTLNDSVSKLDASRAQLPPFAAQYMEQVRVADKSHNGEGSGAQKRARLSWGDRDSDLLYIYAFGPHGSYRQVIGDGKNPLYALSEDKALAANGTLYESASKGSQGGYGTKRPLGFHNPAGVDYEVIIGRTVMDAVRVANSSMIGNDDIQSDAQGVRTVFHLEHIGPQMVVSGFETSAPDSDNSFRESVRVAEWLQYDGRSFPKDVIVSTYSNGAVVKAITYTFLKLLPKPQSYLAWHGWQEGALVKDRDSQVTYVVSHGKLVLDPRFNRDVSTQSIIERVAVVCALMAVGIWLLIRLRRVWLISSRKKAG